VPDYVLLADFAGNGLRGGIRAAATSAMPIAASGISQSQSIARRAVLHVRDRIVLGISEYVRPIFPTHSGENPYPKLIRSNPESGPPGSQSPAHRSGGKRARKTRMAIPGTISSVRRRYRMDDIVVHQLPPNPTAQPVNRRHVSCAGVCFASPSSPSSPRDRPADGRSARWNHCRATIARR
jgi:hypothetical protein